MSEMHSELVAIEETQLENVAGGLDRSRLKRVTVQVNKVEIDNSVFQAGGDINISQSND